MDEFYVGVNPAWTGTMPETIFYARDGSIAGHFIGEQPRASFEQAIRTILASPPLRQSSALVRLESFHRRPAIMLQTRGNKLTWLGHSTFRITTPSGKVIVIDPWVQSNPMCPEPLKKFDRIDTLLITHGHFDHIADAVDLAKQFKPQVVAIYETGVWLESKGVTNVSR